MLNTKPEKTETKVVELHKTRHGEMQWHLQEILKIPS